MTNVFSPLSLLVVLINEHLLRLKLLSRGLRTWVLQSHCQSSNSDCQLWLRCTISLVTILACGGHCRTFAADFTRYNSVKRLTIQDDNVIEENCDSRGVNEVLWKQPGRINSLVYSGMKVPTFMVLWVLLRCLHWLESQFYFPYWFNQGDCRLNKKGKESCIKP